MSGEDRQHSDQPTLVTENPWSALRRFTRARVALGRAGTSLPTSALLAFQLDHARAVDAVHESLDANELVRALESSSAIQSCLNDEPILVRSQAAGRIGYLQRPDLGRRLAEADWQRLHQLAATREKPFDLVILASEGLSATAVQRHAVPFLESLCNRLAGKAPKLKLAPLVIASQARVALGDDVGESLYARMILVLIGERPGLTSPDSMGAYLTWAPRRGLLDSQRNCISNIRPEGLSYADAAAKAQYLIDEARRFERTGIELKDRAEDAVLDGTATRDARPRFRLTGDA